MHNFITRSYNENAFLKLNLTNLQVDGAEQQSIAVALKVAKMLKPGLTIC